MQICAKLPGRFSNQRKKLGPQTAPATFPSVIGVIRVTGGNHIHRRRVQIPRDAEVAWMFWPTHSVNFGIQRRRCKCVLQFARCVVSICCKCLLTFGTWAGGSFGWFSESLKRRICGHQVGLLAGKPKCTVDTRHCWEFLRCDPPQGYLGMDTDRQRFWKSCPFVG